MFVLSSVVAIWIQQMCDDTVFNQGVTAFQMNMTLISYVLRNKYSSVGSWTRETLGKKMFNSDLSLDYFSFFKQH